MGATTTPTKATVNPAVFMNVQSMAEARGVVLTKEGDQGTDERWRRETPYLVDLIIKKIGLLSSAGLFPVVMDYGCGIGRIAKGVLRRTTCSVVGVDISENMRALSAVYVGKTENFVTMSPTTAAKLAIKVDAAFSVWTLQHCHPLRNNIGLISSAVKPGGRFLLVNGIGRALPLEGGLWGNDGVDVRAEIAAAGFEEIETGILDPVHVDPAVSDKSFWALYRRV